MSPTMLIEEEFISYDQTQSTSLQFMGNPGILAFMPQVTPTFLAFGETEGIHL
jgi:hypothetical protein